MFLGFSAAAQSRVDPSRVDRLLQRAVVIDLHDDTTQMIVDEGYNLGEKHDYGQVDIPRMRAGHVSGLFLSIWTDSDRYTPLEAIRRTLQQIDGVRREVRNLTVMGMDPKAATRAGRAHQGSGAVSPS